MLALLARVFSPADDTDPGFDPRSTLFRTNPTADPAGFDYDNDPRFALTGSLLRTTA